MAAEGSSNPYWCNAATMEERIKFHEQVLSEQPDARTFALIVSKSNNDNFVVYKWENATSTLKPYWILIPERSKKPYSRQELNAFDLTLYAPKLTVRDTGAWEITLSLQELSQHVLNLSLNDNDEPSLTGTIKGQRCVVDKAFVEMRAGLLPDVKQITVYGRTVDTNEARFEVLENN
jgi:hypothetical protein